MTDSAPPIPQDLQTKCVLCNGEGMKRKGSFADPSKMRMGSCHSCHGTGWVWALGQQEMAKRIADLEAALAAKWISVDERLPEHHIRVNAWDGIMVEDCFYGKPSSITEQHLSCDWRRTSDESLYPGVKCWQPLPAPPLNAPSS